MNRILSLALPVFLLVSTASAAMSRISDTLYFQNGARYNGSIYISASNTFLASDGRVVQRGTIRVTVVNGVFSVQLEPTDTGLPSGSYYSVSYQLTGGLAAPETWTVPTSTMTLALSSVRTINPPAAGPYISLSDISITGASSGQCIIFSTSAVWGTCPGGAGASAWSALTSGTNTIGAFVMGNGSSLSFTGTGWINANRINGVTLSGLSTGLVKLTAGVPSIAVSNSDFLAAAAIDLSASGVGGVTGNLGVAHLNGGTSAGATTFWSGDGTWKGVTILSGVAFPATPSIHQVPVVTASNTVTYKTVPNCTDTGGNHLNYTQGADAFSCGTSGASVISSVFGRTGAVAATSGDYTASQVTNAVANNAANTGTSAFALDASASTVSNAQKVPVKSGVVTTANGAIGYDSGTNMLHAAQSSGDAMIPQFTATPANNDCAKWVVSGSQYKLGTAGAACGANGGAFSQSFTGQTSVTVTHNLGTLNVTATAYDGSNVVIPWSATASYTVTSTNVVTVAFTGSTTGRIVVTTGTSPVAAPGLVGPLEQHTASSSASLDFTTCFSSTYDAYLFEFVAIKPGTDNVTFRLRLGAGSVDSGNNYQYTGWFNGIGDTLQGAGGSPTSDIDIAHNVGTVTHYSIAGTWRVTNPSSSGSDYPSASGSVTAPVSSATLYKWDLGGFWESTSAADRAQFSFSTGTIASGTILCYGIAK